MLTMGKMTRALQRTRLVFYNIFLDDSGFQLVCCLEGRWRQIGHCLVSHCRDYCQQTTIHGFSYLTNENLKLERAFWSVVILSGLFLAGLIINSALGYVLHS